MGVIMEEDLKHWTANVGAALVKEISQGNTSVFEEARPFVSPSEIEDWVDALDIKERCERQLKEREEAYAVVLRPPKLHSLG